MQLTLDHEDVEILLALIDLNIRALRTAIAGSISHQDRAIHGIRLINLQRTKQDGRTNELTFTPPCASRCVVRSATAGW